MIPKGIYDEIERIARQFLWEVASEHSKISLVGWDSLCQLGPVEVLGYVTCMIKTNLFSWNLGLV